jgi:hypothetical protein
VQKDTVTNNIKEELLGADVKLMADVEGTWKTMVDAKNVFSSYILTSQFRQHFAEQTGP